MVKESEFKPAWWLRSPHLQTMWSTLFRRLGKLVVNRERFDLNDGDFVDLDWVGLDNQGPIILVLHGMGGSINSPYANGILQAIVSQGWCGVLMHFRGCSGEPNRLPRYYHSGETQDVAEVVSALAKRYPGIPIAAIGYSLGGNVLLKWLGETREANPLKAAVAVSVPFVLDIAAKRVSEGFCRIYQWTMLRDLRKQIIKKFVLIPPPFDLSKLAQLRNFHEFDSYFTAPLHGFKDASDFYEQCSSKQFLKYIKVPTLILHASDDPLLAKDIMFDNQDLSEHVVIELSQYGGHVGFISGNIPLWPEYWLEKRIPEYLKDALSSSESKKEI